MASILRTQPGDERADAATITLDDEPPNTVPLSGAGLTAVDVAMGIAASVDWDERDHAPGDREPTLDLGVKQRAAAFEAVQAAVLQATAQPQLLPPPPPNVLRGRYRLEQPIAAGGSAFIYRAHDLERDAAAARIAVKLLKPECRNDAAAVERLKREYAYTLRLSHPHIVRVYDLDYCERYGWFMTMELLEGESLAAQLRRHDPQLRYERKLAIVVACGQALAFAHRHGVLHCDFKPSNVMVMPSGEIRLLDFGAARIARDTEQIVHRAAAATPAYASAQVLGGEPADVRDDLFSLACMTYELFAGHHPFGNGSDAGARRAPHALTRPIALNWRQWHALQRGLSATRDQRQASIAAFLKDLQPHPRAMWWWTIAVLTVAALVMTQRMSPPRAARQPVAFTATATDSVPRVTARPVAFDVFAPLVPHLSVALYPPPRTTPMLQMSTAHEVLPPLHNDQPATPSKPAARSVVGFEQAHVHVSDRAVAAALTVERNRADATQRIQWRTVDGSARAGVDYEASVDSALFNKHQTRRTIYINLKKNPAADRDRDFVVELRLPGGGKQVARIDVTIRHSGPGAR